MQRCNITKCVLFPPGIQKAWAQYHDRFTGALFELRLNGAELAVDDGHHALDLTRRHGPGARLLPQQVHNMGCELTAGLETAMRLESSSFLSEDSQNRVFISQTCISVLNQRQMLWKHCISSSIECRSKNLIHFLYRTTDFEQYLIKWDLLWTTRLLTTVYAFVDSTYFVYNRVQTWNSWWKTILPMILQKNLH